jgi:hypothetical protein
MKTTDLITVRPGAQSDRPFIFSTWLRGLRYGNDYFELIESSNYYENHHKIIQDILDDGSTVINVACLKDDPDVILGYAVYAMDRLHYVHVKASWRKIGVARMIVPTFIQRVSHLTATGKSLLAKAPGVVYDPYNLV